ncbi:HAD hydrolase-like protein, partial [candidate division KSB3 bacterium]|nr:HAD hydrolase-like protein [candidate division KSB3 bacterium]MBD3325043.1 HAD hydrolase-like protein [candidate division KSB3 bacterium]
MQNPHKILDELQPQKEFFVGIDSDGCAFDTMEIKHKECFCPNTIKHWGLQAVSKYAREAAEFVNLYSKSRGINRFPALIEVIDLLRERPEVIARNAKLPDLTPLIEWTKKETKLGNPVLKKYMEETDDPVIKRTYEWSTAVNATVKDMVHGIPPFPFMRESLIKLIEKADVIVVSQTPVEALEREWKENEIDQYVRVIAGQEYGTKSEHLKYAAKGKYPEDKILMIGDAPGDYKAATDNGVLFYPINPGAEEASWERFYNEAI